ncbi:MULTISPECIES: SPFH domain-containing protein [unclassified Dermacoccus]|uniref:SPFH domain-containing protein n=1 Tax=unclassified Dermacoccus TaxID=2643059 RepID=UPI00101D0F14|nr:MULTISPECIES: SPFH domain-containing protein [unclassified Dermacoccus]MBZ4496485.1 SPFH/Band 7/PHB domain protein [Dermacoccus sp. Tok2021]RYI23743.1 SPFH/Band 7/PHB domain protein [Dermacoccus sp. 147Ba]
MSPGLIAVLLLVLFVVVVLMRTVRIVPQQTAQIIERLGSYNRTLTDGLHILVPFIDRVRANIDLREQVVTFPPQPVITSDNLVVSIDTVIYYSVTDPKSAVYEIENFIQGIEQLTVTTLRNVIGSLDLEQTLTSRDQINGQLRGVLDEATGRWGIRVNRVELKAIDPPASVQDSMEKQMRAERDRRAAILNAEGFKQSQILTAEGEKQSSILKAEGEAQAAILKAQGEARAIQQVFDAIHRGKPTQRLLAYQYLQTLPQLAQGDSNKMWVIPSEVTDALRGISSALGGDAGRPGDNDDEEWVDPGTNDTNAFADTTLEDPEVALANARGEANQATTEAERNTQTAARPVRAAAPSAAEDAPSEVERPQIAPSPHVAAPTFDEAAGSPEPAPQEVREERPVRAPLQGVNRDEQGNPNA